MESPDHIEGQPAAPEPGSPFTRGLIVTALAFFMSGAAVLLGDPRSGWMYLPQAVLLLAVTNLIATGANWLVDAACRIAQRLGVSYLTIGLTVVAMGTSAPELAASLLAGVQGRGDITVANVIGSNIFNLCFILGTVAVIVGGLHVERALMVRDAPLLLLVSVLLFLFVGSAPLLDDEAGMLLDLHLGRVEGVLLLATLMAYILVLYRSLRRATRHQRASQPERDSYAQAQLEELEKLPKADEVARRSVGRDLLWLAAGLVLVVGGSHVLVGHAEVVGEAVRGFGALWFASMWQVPDYIVGVTVVAAGTSAPEFVISLVAASRGAFGMSAGNLVGSDLFNMLGVLGISGIVLQPPIAPPVTLTAAAVPSLLALSGLVALLLVFMWTGRRISRLEGFVLILVGVLRWTMDFAFRGTL